MKIILLLVTLFFTIGINAQLIEVEFQNKTEEASFIAEGEVVSENFFYADGSQDIYTIYELSIFKIFKGDESNISNENRMYVILPGGRIGNEELLVEPNLNLEVGEVGTILLKNNTVAATDLGYPSNLLYEPIQNAQSRFSYDCETGEVLGFFQTFPSIPNFYDQLSGFSGQTTIEVQAYEPCILPIPADPQAIVITGFSPASAPAGAQEILTITGTGFGATQGSQGVFFYKHSQPGALSRLPTSQFISWTDTQIELYVPYYAGTGRFAIGYVSSHVYSSTDLIIPYSETNVANPPSGSNAIYYQTRHVRDTPGGAGGYIWELNTAFAANTDAVDAFDRARENWVCDTRMNWYIDAATTSINTPTTDNINVVTFDASMSSGVLGLCYTRFSNCGGERYVTEQDLTFNSATNWNFTTNSPTSSEVDFESVALHELGHSRLLNHVIDPNKVMHRSASLGNERRTISADEQTGGLSINERSTNIFNEICGQDAMIGIFCPPPFTTGIPDINFEEELIYLEYDWGPPDGWVYTENINTVGYLDLDGLDIADLTGIEDFIALQTLTCMDNNITSLELSNNPELISLQLNNNPLINLNVKNGNNTAIELFSTLNNPDLYCIEVDDEEYSTTNWTGIDPQTGFSEDCILGISDISEINISIYPNPASDIINIVTEIDAGIMIYDIQGRLIINEIQLYAGDNKLDVSNYKTGIYFIKISSVENSIIKRVIIE
jgi:hypothetical protein